jgi:sterol desaturase/sphingolipid hydroxylase (fatty acid hydroxylase superfamily)
MTDQSLSATAVAEPGTARTGIVPSSYALGVGAVVLVWIGIGSLQRSGGVWSGLAEGRAVLLAPAVLSVVAMVVVLERRWPAEARKITACGHLQDGGFFLFHIVAVVPFMTLLSVAFAHLLQAHIPWVAPAWLQASPLWLLAALTFVLMDVSNWCAHYADHRFQSLWRVHALHHSQEELSVLTSFRAHPLSHLPGFMLAAIPPFFLLGSRGAPVLISLYVCLGTIPHANLNWSYGALGRIVVSPAYHRLHHAVDGVNGRNLGVVLTVWDVLIGRADFPAPGGPVRKTGLRGRPVPVEQSPGDRWRPELLVLQLAEPFVAHAGPEARPS